MTETTKDAKITTEKSDGIYEEQRRNLVEEILSALKNADGIDADLAKVEQLEATRDRLKGELSTLLNDKERIAAEIENLKANFGVSDSISDTDKLKTLSSDLAAIDIAVPIVESRLAKGSTLETEINDLRAQVAGRFYSPMGKIKEQLQNVLDAKTADIEKTYICFFNAFSDAASCLDVMHKQCLPREFSTHFLPDSKKLEELLGEFNPFGSKLKDRTRNKIFQEYRVAEMKRDNAARKPQPIKKNTHRNDGIPVDGFPGGGDLTVVR